MTYTSLTDRVVLVTGSTTGIGEATARRCIFEGCHVMIHGRNEQRARRLADELGERAAYVTADLASEDAASRVVDATIARFGRVDAIVNNAALTTRGNIDTTGAQLFDLLFAVNLKAPLFIIQRAIPHFRRQGGGIILNVGSVNAHCGEPNLLVYSMTKGGLATMTRNLADALGSEHIRVNQINVGWTLTDNERKIKQEEGLPSGWEHQLPSAYAPAGRIFDPDEVANHIAFWISDEAGPVSGAIFELEQFPLIGRNPDKSIDEG